MRYALNAWPALLVYCGDGAVEIDNNAVEREIRAVALGRKNYLFAGSDAGGDSAAGIYGLVGTAKLNRFDRRPTCAVSSISSPTTKHMDLGLLVHPGDRRPARKIEREVVFARDDKQTRQPPASTTGKAAGVHNKPRTIVPHPIRQTMGTEVCPCTEVLYSALFLLA